MKFIFQYQMIICQLSLHSRNIFYFYIYIFFLNDISLDVSPVFIQDILIVPILYVRLYMLYARFAIDDDIFLGKFIM